MWPYFFDKSPVFFSFGLVDFFIIFFVRSISLLEDDVGVGITLDPR